MKPPESIDELVSRLIASDRRRDLVRIAVALADLPELADPQIDGLAARLAAWTRGEPVDIGTLAAEASRVARERSIARGHDSLQRIFALLARAQVVELGAHVATGVAWPEPDLLGMYAARAFAQGKPNRAAKANVFARARTVVSDDVPVEPVAAGYFRTRSPHRMTVMCAHKRFQIEGDVERTGDIVTKGDHFVLRSPAGDAVLRLDETPLLELGGASCPLEQLTSIDDFPLIGRTPVSSETVRQALVTVRPPVPLDPQSIRVVDLTQRRKHVYVYYLARALDDREVLVRTGFAPWTTIRFDEMRVVELEEVAPEPAPVRDVRGTAECERGTLVFHDVYEPVPARNWEEECWTEVVSLVRDGMVRASRNVA